MAQRVARRTLPQKPIVPELPATAFPERRFRVPGTELEIRPLAPPSIEIPANEDEDLIRRFEAWHARTNGSLPEYLCYEFLVFENIRKYSFETRLWKAVDEQLGLIGDHFARIAAAFRHQESQKHFGKICLGIGG